MRMGGPNNVILSLRPLVSHVHRVTGEFVQLSEQTIVKSEEEITF